MARQIKAHIQIKGGKLLCGRNFERIVARSVRATDRQGNRLDAKGKSPLDGLRNDPPYFRRWRLVRESEGFIFREVQNGAGICGHAETIRQQVLKVLLTVDDIVIEVED